MSFIGELTDQRCKVCNTKYAYVIKEVIQIRQQLSQESMQQIGVTNMKLHFPSYFCLFAFQISVVLSLVAALSV